MIDFDVLSSLLKEKKVLKSFAFVFGFI